MVNMCYNSTMINDFLMLMRLSTTMTSEIPVLFQAAFDDAIGNKNVRNRNKSRYSREEINVLEKYKDTYRRKTTTDERHELFRQYILVDIFNHWHSKGVVSAKIGADELQDRIKVQTWR